MIDYLKSLVETFREANASNAPLERAANEARITNLEQSIALVEPFVIR